MKSVRENLIAAKALIDTPEKWNQSGSFGHDGCWCAVGALEQIGGEFNHFRTREHEWRALHKALPERAKDGKDFYDIFNFNDDPDTTHAEIMALFDRAIEAQP